MKEERKGPVGASTADSAKHEETARYVRCTLPKNIFRFKKCGCVCACFF
jgi:hypothetical protein